MIALDALHRLANNRQLIFSDANQDAEFFGCLCYCLIVLIDETGMKQSLYDRMKNFFHRTCSECLEMKLVVDRLGIIVSIVRLRTFHRIKR